jgi:hypothetical protein
MTLILVAIAVCLVAFVLIPSRSRAPSSRHEIGGPDSGELLKPATPAVQQEPMPAITPPAPPPQPQLPELKTLAEVAERYGEALKGLGWIVELDSETLGCYRPKKRGGGRLKNPTVKLSHTPATADAGPRQQPWSVQGPQERGRTWGSLEGALPVFLKEAGLQSDA